MLENRAELPSWIHTNQRGPFSSLDHKLLCGEVSRSHKLLNRVFSGQAKRELQRNCKFRTAWAVPLFSKSCWKRQQMLCTVLSGGWWIHLTCPHWFWGITPAFCATNKKVIRRHLDFFTIVTCHMPNLKTGFCRLYALSPLGNHGHFNFLILSHFPPGRFTPFSNEIVF